MIDTTVSDRAERLSNALEAAVDDLARLREHTATATAEAKRIYQTAILDARDHGCRNREERIAHAELAACDAQAAADIAQMTYRDQLTYIRVLQTQLDLARTEIVTQRQVSV